MKTKIALVSLLLTCGHFIQYGSASDPAQSGWGRFTTVGEPTWGSTGQPLSLQLPGGGGARICTKRDTYPDGRDFVGYGVQPAVKIERTPAALIGKEDNILSKGLEVLKGKL